jgi:hypothetical protein
MLVLATLKQQWGLHSSVGCCVLVVGLPVAYPFLPCSFSHFGSTLVWAQQLHRVFPRTYSSQIPSAPQRLWCDGDIFNSCHSFFFFFSLLAVDPPHPLSELIQGTRRLAVNLRREVSDHLHKRSPVNWQCSVSGHLHFNVCSAPPMMVHAELFRVVLATLFHICCWCMLSPHRRQCMSSAHIMFSLMGETCKWNVTVDAFLSTHDPSWLIDFYQIFDRVTEKINANRNSDPKDVPVVLPVEVILDQRKWVVGFWQESIWSQFLHYLASMGQTHTSYNSHLELQRI